jgi:hypothetical protein
MRSSAGVWLLATLHYTPMAPAAVPPIPDWDVALDGQADITGLGRIVSRWGLTSWCAGWIREDVNNDGKVSLFDLAEVERVWGQSGLICDSAHFCYLGSQLPPGMSTGGFSSGSWNGTPDPNPAYHYGIVDASIGPTGTVTLCSWPSALSPSFAGGEQTLLASGAPYLQAFWFLTSVAYARNVCSNATVTPADWGKRQADWFVDAMDSLPANVKQDIWTTFADIEIVSDDIAQWGSAPTADNQAVISSFFAELSAQEGSCACGGLPGIYTGPSNWWDIIGIHNTDPSQPYLGAPWLWMSSWGADQTHLDQQDQWFTNSPGGYYIWSWQYTDTSCDPSNPNDTCSGSTTEGPGGSATYCWMTYDQAQMEAIQASPPIPAFDKWTNSAPDQVCQ